MNGVYIASVDAKDLYLSNNYIKSSNNGYRLRKADGKYNIKRFKNSLDYSLDLIKLREVYDKAHIGEDGEFTFTDSGKELSRHVINVTFKYSVKEFNPVLATTYIRNGYSMQDVELTNGVYELNGELIAIVCDEPVTGVCSNLPKYFTMEDLGNGTYRYHAKSSIPVIMRKDALRTWIYRNGFWADGIHYVRFKRSSGSARVGKCLFINERFYSRMHAWEKCGYTLREGQKIDLAAWESYIALTSSSIIDTLELDPKSILVIDDYESVFTDKVMVTREIGGHYATEPEDNYVVKNSIWDGQSLIDISAMGKYSDKGMILMRNRFFKSCCFNTNIQQFFRDNNITELSQLNGFTLAESVEDIKLITTPSSIKFLKFGKLEEWLERIEPTFGVVKYEKKTHFMGGRLVQVHYQLLNTLQMTFDEVKELLKPTADYIIALRTDPAVLRDYLKFADYNSLSIINAKDRNDVIYALMNLNDQFPKTKIYRDFVTTLCQSFKTNTKKGHILVNGNYSTLFGNPFEMLLQSIGRFDGESHLGVGNIHSIRFGFGQMLLGSRSPHVTIGNVWLPNNVECSEIDRYFNITPEICCMNAIGENVLARLSGSDFDSDTALLTDNHLMIEAAKRNYDKFLVPTSDVSQNKISRHFTQEEKADLDYKTSENEIGEIINFSQILNSLLWDRIANGETVDDCMDLYADISQLDVMSNIEIDKAKKIFNVNNGDELRILKKKYRGNGKDVRPFFFMHIDKLKGYYNKDRRDYILFQTTMDYLSTIMDSFMNSARRVTELGREPLSYVLDADKSNYKDVDYNQVYKTVEIIRSYKSMAISYMASDTLDWNEKKILMERLLFETKAKLSKIKYSVATSYTLMKMIDTPEYKDISDVMFYVLLSLPVNNFYNVFAVSRDNIVCLSSGDEDSYDCEYYGKKYKHFLKTADGDRAESNYKYEDKIYKIWQKIGQKK